MLDLLKRSFNLYCQKRWLKLIDKELNKYNKIRLKLSIQTKVLNDLMKRYNELYDGDFGFGEVEVYDE